MGEERGRADVWWEPHDVEEGRGGSFHIGALQMWVAHLSGEWRIAIEYDADQSEEEVVTRCPESIVDPPEAAAVHRFATGRADERLSLLPVLADRSIVARPEVPFSVLPDDEARFFISTSVWVCVNVGDPPSRLLEVPTIRASDTWFGATTRDGDICYASRTAARMRLANVVRRSSRAITSVVVRNRAEDALHLERIALPVPALSLFSDVAGHLWTEEVTVERDREGHVAQVKIERRPPRQVEKPERVAAARHPEAQNVFVKALSSLLR